MNGIFFSWLIYPLGGWNEDKENARYAVFPDLPDVYHPRKLPVRQVLNGEHEILCAAGPVRLVNLSEKEVPVGVFSFFRNLSPKEKK